MGQHKVAVTLNADQWPAVLYALDQLAKAKKADGRDMAEAVAIEIKMAIRAQVDDPAPDLLAALEAILNDVEGYGLAHPEGGRFECDHNDTARAAIARAKGGQ